MRRLASDTQAMQPVGQDAEEYSKCPRSGRNRQHFRYFVLQSASLTSTFIQSAHHRVIVHLYGVIIDALCFHPPRKEISRLNSDSTVLHQVSSQEAQDLHAHAHEISVARRSEDLQSYFFTPCVVSNIEAFDLLSRHR